METATRKAIDGYFTDGPLKGKSVNIKWYPKRENVLDITPDALPDYYLVLTGPKSPAVSSKGKVRPWLINSVYLFNAKELVSKLYKRGLKIYEATSVKDVYWGEAEIYPENNNHQYSLNQEQKDLLNLFSRVSP